MTRALPLKSCDRHNCARQVRVGIRFCKDHEVRPVSLHMPDGWDVAKLEAIDRYAMTAPERAGPIRRGWNDR